MKVLVTGANGHIGCHVVRSAIAAGMTPIAFVREKSDRRGLAGLDIEVRTGDVLDADSVRKAMEGVEIVFHVAAAHKNFAADPKAITDPAILGTRNVAAAAREAKVRRLVYTSTGATIGFTTDPNKPLTEDTFLDSATNPYVQGKIAAEKLALDSGVETVVLNPSGVFGPRDYRITPATRAIIGVLQGDPMFFWVCVTDVRDVAEGHVLAATKGTPGRRYLLTGQAVSPKETAATFAKLAGIKPPTFRPPKFLAKFIAGRAEKKAAREGTDAPLTRAMVEDNFDSHLVYDSTRARKELGVRFRDPETVLRDTFRWLVFIDALAPKIKAKVTAALGEAAAPDPDWRT